LKDKLRVKVSILVRNKVIKIFETDVIQKG